MKQVLPLLLAVASVPLVLAARQGPSDREVTVVERKAERRVDVSVGGKPFTSYIYPQSLEKPVLYPIHSASGAPITRGYPLDPRPGEAADHPHHVGHWFNYGDVNGFDFWGHSSETPAANKPKMGVIVHKAILAARGGADSGMLTATADWNVPDGSTLLHEQVVFEFSGAAGQRSITRTTTWTAADRPVTFNDTKEGAFGIRVARELDHASKQPVRLVGSDGKAEAKPRLDNSKTTGSYLASDGTEGEAVWGTRGPWMALRGTLGGEPVTVVILDHPSNHGHPTYWHARGYGLFAANPFGRQGYDPKQQPATFTLKPGAAMTFRHRILVLDGHPSRDDLQKAFAAFAAGKGKPGL
jgi:hypothetical protein